MDKYSKADKLLEEGGVLFRGKSKERLYFLVRGKQKKFYEIIVEKSKGLRFHCDCNYFLPGDCSHILACKLFLMNEEKE